MVCLIIIYYSFNIAYLLFGIGKLTFHDYSRVLYTSLSAFLQIVKVQNETVKPLRLRKKVQYTRRDLLILQHTKLYKMIIKIYDFCYYF